MSEKEDKERERMKKEKGEKELLLRRTGEKEEEERGRNKKIANAYARSEMHLLFLREYSFRLQKRLMK